MTGVALLLLTQLTAPVTLLWLGHGYRNRSRRAKRFFWGGIVGYLAAIVGVTVLLLLPPVFWGSDGGLRWLAIQATPLILPAASAAVWSLARSADQPG
jgi:hypothetical protein